MRIPTPTMTSTTTSAKYSSRGRIQRLMLAPPRPETIGEAPKVFLVNLVENADHGLLDNLVFQRRDPQRALPPVSFRDVHPSRWLHSSDWRR